jgi:SAM-dependent methyltransferase/uncharacterized protein YbaR (Trm112 family)
MTKLNNHSEFECPSCHSKLKQKNKPILICNHCNNEYPIFKNSFPILIKDAKKYLAKYLIEIEHEIERLNRHLNALENKKESIIVLEDIQQLENLKSETIKHITIDDIIKNKNKTQEYGYFNTKEYLIRDWSNSKNSEKELEDIILSLKEEISKYLMKDKIALVPGGGLGRISYELSDIFKQIYSFDISLTMCDMLAEIQTKRKIIKTLNTKNALTEKDKIKEYNIDLKSIFIKSKAKNIKHVINFVGDSKNIPLANNSVDIIISFYFSDIIPLNEYIEEFYRVLKKGGVFVHFGPLDYHFNDTSKHYSLETFFSHLEGFGFEVDKNYKLIKTLNSNNGLNIKGYENILFSAIKKETLSFQIKNNIKLYFDKPFKYTMDGSFKNGDYLTNKNSFIQFFDNTIYSYSENLFQILEIFEEGFTIDMILTKMKLQFGLKEPEHKKEIVKQILFLINKKVLKM